MPDGIDINFNFQSSGSNEIKRALKDLESSLAALKKRHSEVRKELQRRQEIGFDTAAKSVEEFVKETQKLQQQLGTLAASIAATEAKIAQYHQQLASLADSSPADATKEQADAIEELSIKGKEAQRIFDILSGKTDQAGQSLSASGKEAQKLGKDVADAATKASDLKSRLLELARVAPSMDAEESIRRLKELYDEALQQREAIKVALDTTQAEQDIRALQKDLNDLNELIRVMEFGLSDSDINTIDKTGEALGNVENKARRVSGALADIITGEPLKRPKEFVEKIDRAVASLEQRLKKAETAEELSRVYEDASRAADVLSRKMGELSAELATTERRFGYYKSGALQKALLDMQSALSGLSNIRVKIDPSSTEAFTESVKRAREAIDNLHASLSVDLTEMTRSGLTIMEKELRANKAALDAHINTMLKQKQQLGDNEQLTEELNKAIRESVEAYTETERALDRVRQRLKEIRREESRIGRGARGAFLARMYSQERLAARAEAYEYGRIGMSVRAVGRGLGRLGANIEEPAYIAGDVLRAVRGIKMLKDELPDLFDTAVEAAGGVGKFATSLGAAGAAVVAFILVTKSLQKAQEESARRVKMMVESFKKIADLTVEGGTEGARQEIERLNNQIAKRRAQLDITQSEIDTIEATRRANWELFKDVNSTFEGALAGLITISDSIGFIGDSEAVNDWRNLRKEADKLREEIKGDEQALERLNRALNNQAFIAADLAQQWEKSVGQSANDIVARLRALQQAQEQLISGTGDPQQIRDAIAKFQLQEDYSNIIVGELQRFRDSLGGALTPEISKVIDGLIQDAQESARAAEIQKSIAENVLLPAYTRAWQAAQRSSKAIDELNSYYERSVDIRKRMLTESDPDAVRREMRELQIEIESTSSKLEELHRKYVAGIITPEDFDEQSQALRDTIDDLLATYDNMNNMLLPAAEKNKALADALAVVASKSKEAEDAMREMADAMRDEWLQGIDQAAQLAAESLTATDPQGIREEMRGLSASAEVYRRAISDLHQQYRNGEVSASEFNERNKILQNTLDQTTSRLDYLTQLLPYALDTERIESFANRMADMVKFMQQTDEIFEDRVRQLEREQFDFERRRAKQITDFYASLADFDAKFYEDLENNRSAQIKAANKDAQKERDELYNFYKKMRRLAEDHKRKMLDIYKDMQDGIESAVEERSVSAAVQAIRAGKEKAEEEEENYRIEKRRREEDFRDKMRLSRRERDERRRTAQQQLQDLYRQHQKEREARIRAFQQRLREEDYERQLRLQRQQEDWRIQDERRFKHFMDTENAYASHYTRLLTMANATFSSIETKFKEAFQIGQTTTTAPSVVGGYQAFDPEYMRMRGYQHGGRVRPGDWVRVGESGEEMARFWPSGRWEIIPGRGHGLRGTKMQGDVVVTMPVTMNINNGDPQLIEATFERRILPKITRAITSSVMAR